MCGREGTHCRSKIIAQFTINDFSGKSQHLSFKGAHLRYL
jgi:hypothetical protein